MRKVGKFPIPNLGLSFLVVFLLAVFTLLILACGEDKTPTATQKPGVTGTSFATSTPTKAATKTTTAGVPVKPQIVVSIPPGNEQGTLSYSFTQVSEKTMPEYDHLLGKDPVSDEIIPEMAKS